MFNFGEFAEEWAVRYKPMSHTPEKGGKNKRFFPCEGINSIPAMIAAANGVKSPILMVESDVEGKATDRFFYNEYHLYFCCKDSLGTDPSGLATKREAAKHMEKFIAYLNECKDKDSELYKPGLEKVELENMQYYSINLFQDGWYGAQLDIVNIEPIDLEVSDDDYNY